MADPVESENAGGACGLPRAAGVGPGEPAGARTAGSHAARRACAALLADVAVDVPTFGPHTSGEFTGTVGGSGFHNATLSALVL